MTVFHRNLPQGNPHDLFFAPKNHSLLIPKCPTMCTNQEQCKIKRNYHLQSGKIKRNGGFEHKLILILRPGRLGERWWKEIFERGGSWLKQRGNKKVFFLLTFAEPDAHVALIYWPDFSHFWLFHSVYSWHVAWLVLTKSCSSNNNNNNNNSDFGLGFCLGPIGLLARSPLLSNVHPPWQWVCGARWACTPGPNTASLASSNTPSRLFAPLAQYLFNFSFLCNIGFN